MRKKDASIVYLIAIVIIAYPFVWLYQTIGPVGFLAVAIVAALGCIYWISSKNKGKQLAFNDLLLTTMTQRTPPEIARSINQTLMRQDHRKGQLVRYLQIIKDSIDISLNSKKRDIAESRMKTVNDMWHEVESQYSDLFSDEVFSKVKAIVIDAQHKYHTVLYMNVARGHIEKATTLKTDKAKEKYLTLAQEVILEGLDNPNSDKSELHSLQLKIGKASEVG